VIGSIVSVRLKWCWLRAVRYHVGGGKGAVSALTGEGFYTVALTFNADRTARSWSISATDDPSGNAWARDAKGRPRTFATEEAAHAFASSRASGPLYVERYDRGQDAPAPVDPVSAARSRFRDESLSRSERFFEAGYVAGRCADDVNMPRAYYAEAASKLGGEEKPTDHTDFMRGLRRALYDRLDGKNG